MDNPCSNASGQVGSEAETLTLDHVITVVVESAVEAFVKAILVTIFGTIAVGLASGIWEEMAPSPPPGFAEGTGGSVHAITTALDEHLFAIAFGFIFVPTIWFRLANRRAGGESPKPTSRLQKIGRRLADQWFELIMVNAIGAIFSAIVLVWFQNLTLSRLLFGWAVEWLLSGAQTIVQALFGTNAGQSFRSWFDWYGDNAFKFSFWLFYLAAICDDLGIPNFKTLGRWFGRKIRHRRQRARQENATKLQGK